jgi:integrase
VQILTVDELQEIIATLKQRARRSRSTETNLVIVRLACCCGLRASEISGLELRDFHFTKIKPRLHVRGSGGAKGGKDRYVPLWWDAENLHALSEHVWLRRTRDQAALTSRLVVSTHAGSIGAPLNRHQVRRRFIVSMNVLGRARARQLTTHSGRHTFITLALIGGRALAEVRDAAGHSNIAVTDLYSHIADDSGALGDVFSRSRSVREAPELPAVEIVTRRLVPRAKDAAPIDR